MPKPLARVRATAISLLLAFSVAPVDGQTGSGVIRGVVLDLQGSGVVGAKMTLTVPDGGRTREVQTGSDGEFVFPNLQPGAYDIGAEAAGFKKAVQAGIRASVAATTDVSIRLELGPVTESISVSAQTQPLQTADATVGNNFDGTRIQQLPLNARNIVGLLSLQPGVTRSGEAFGGRRDQANITLDGVDVNDQLTGLDAAARSLQGSYEALSSVLRSTPESVQEFRVVTLNPNANQGRSSGAQVSLVTRSGGNTFHGATYWFHRNTLTTANDWFNNAAGRYLAADTQVLQGIATAGDPRVPRPKLIRNIFGAALGGPIKRNKTFFFANYEGRRDASETSVLRTVPSESLREGILRYQNTSGGTTTVTPAQFAALFPGTGGVNPVVLDYLRRAPLPNFLGAGDGLNLVGYRFNASTPAIVDTYIARLDHRISDSQSLFVRGNIQGDKYTLPRQFPDSATPAFWSHPNGFVVGHDWTVTPRLINTVRLGLTRQSFSYRGDADANAVRFFTYRPTSEQRSSSRVSPTWNLTDDLSWSKGKHLLQFGGNFRAIENQTESFIFDLLSTNFAFYNGGANALNAPLPGLASSFAGNSAPAVAILLGRLTQYTANVHYDRNGNIQPVGTPLVRTYRTKETEAYIQDVWRVRRDITLTIGLRWSGNSPVQEIGGYQIAPTVNLNDFFNNRVAGAEAGRPFNDPIGFDRSGRANGKPDPYRWNKSNFGPSAAIAWSPHLGNDGVSNLLGLNGKSVIRGGFRMLYDRFGSALMSLFDANALGFTAATQVASGSFNLTNNLPPLLTGQTDTRGLPLLPSLTDIAFPRSFPSDEAGRFASALDASLRTPVQYVWNVSYGRDLGKDFTVEIGYTGRAARNLLVSRDIVQRNNLREPASGQTWFQAAGVLGELHDAGLLLGTNGFNAAVPALPFFENLFPGNRIQQAAERSTGRALPVLNGLTPSQQAAALVAKGSGLNNTNWGALQGILDDSSVLGRNAFIHPQYLSLLTYSTMGTSDYNGGFISVRKRFSSDVAFDFNYTLSKSFDTGSGLEGGGGPNFEGLLLNSLSPNGSRSVSDFDIRHNFNANYLVGLPVGKGKRFVRNASSFVDALIGGWQLTGIWRYHSGLPINFPDAAGRNAVASQQSSRIVRTRPIQSSPGDVNGRPNLFSDPTYAYQSLRNPRAGEEGDRNVFRLPHYTTMDMGLGKSFRMPYSEQHSLQFRWEVFNVTNAQPFDGRGMTVTVNQDPNLSTPVAQWGQFTQSATPTGETRPGRIMQFALRYSF
jgi:hypothetical protein